MGTILGEGEHRYEVVENWGKLPPGLRYSEVAAVGVDSKDNVYVFARGQNPMIVFDREGNFLRTWGQGLFVRAHGLHIGTDDTLYCTDDGDHTVRHMTTEGKLLMEIGIPGKPAEYMSGEPFHRCTTPPCPPAAISMSRTATATRGSTSIRRMGSCCSPGASLAPIRGSSTSSTTSAATTMAGSMSRTGRTIASRSSTARASMKPNGTTCTAPAVFA